MGLRARGLSLVIACLLGCGGPAKPVVAPARPVTAQAVVLDPACTTAETVALPASFRFRCRELPLEVTWPAGTKLKRADSDSTTLFSADLDRGVMLVIVEPAFEAPTPERFGTLLSALVSGLVADATTTPLAPPPLAGATVTAGFSFKTPDGGAGVIRGYVAHHWIVAIVAGGRLADTPARPEHPVGKAFLDSLSLHEPLASPALRIALAKGAQVDIPATVWPTKSLAVDEPNVHDSRGYVLPAQRVGLTLREIARGDHCTALRGTVDSGVEAWLKLLFTGAPFEIKKATRAKLGDAAAYAEVEQDGRRMALYLICHDASFVQISVFGLGQHDELHAILDPIAKSFVGAPANQP